MPEEATKEKLDHEHYNKFCSQCRYNREKCREVFQSLPDPVPCADFIQAPRIILDTRELSGGLIRAVAMQMKCYFEVETLDVGDAVLSSRVGIERKVGGKGADSQKGEDFLASLITDPKIFGQLWDLKNAYDRPMLIIEGTNPEIFCAERNIDPYKLQGVLISIEIGMGIPIHWTKSVEETATLLIHIAEREQLTPEARWFKSHGKRSHLSPQEQLVYAVSAIPKLGQGKSTLLLEHFNSIQALANASKNDIKQIPGFGEKTARLITEFYMRPYKQEASKTEEEE